MKILIVEDESLVQTLFKLRLERIGHEVFAANSGEGALELIRDRQPDVVLLDLLLEGKINGIEVLNKYHEFSPNSRVIVLTGRQEISEEEVIQLGAYAFLRKPIPFDRLEQILLKAGDRS